MATSTPNEWIQGLEGSTSHVTLPGHIRISLIRFATGYVLAAVSAILLGLILGSLPKVFQFINPILQIIRPIAPVAFLPLSYSGSESVMCLRS